MINILEHKKVLAIIDSPNGAAARRFFKHFDGKIYSYFHEGRSKHQDKCNNHGKPLIDCIYSYSTLDSYLSVSCRFGIWVIETHHCYHLSEARCHVAEYLQMRIDRRLSAWTIHLDASALAKLYQCSYLDFGVPLPPRHRGDIVNHFIDQETLDRIDRKYPELSKFCRACGLRRKELGLLRVEDIYTTSTGKVIVHVRQGKGGKKRNVVALDSFPLELRDRAIAEGRDKIFDTIPSDFLSHIYRKLFAQALYDQIARPRNNLTRKQFYFCRGDMAGYVFDRMAMYDVSKALGHNRLSVVTIYLKKAIIDDPHAMPLAQAA